MWQRSNSQLLQDILALCITNEKHSGYFVEFGACDGKFISNSYLLESEFGWSGIVAEPARTFRKQISENRSCRTDTRCVWSRTGEMLRFVETKEPEYSTLPELVHSDMVAQFRDVNETYEVETVSLNDLLSDHRAPEHIDYLSIDTEGTEFDILNAFDFSRYSFELITVEHNYGQQRALIHDLLASKGYSVILQHLSQWDDWYVRRR
jgi:FkbM family methyltransferase